MGKKDGKRVDKVKVDAKKAKQAAKQTKLVKKSVKKEIKELGEDDIEMMIAEVGNQYCVMQMDFDELVHLAYIVGRNTCYFLLL